MEKEQAGVLSSLSSFGKGCFSCSEMQFYNDSLLCFTENLFFITMNDMFYSVFFSGEVVLGDLTI